MKLKIFALYAAAVLAGAGVLTPIRTTHAIFGEEAAIAEAIDQAEGAIIGILRKRLFDMVVDQIVNWIQGGGQPLFVQNWETFLGQYGNIVTGDLVKQLNIAGICRPFGIQLQIAVMQPPRFSSQMSCTLDQIVGNMVNFYNNFRTGGFVAYREIWQPRNNFYGALLLTMDEKETQIADRRFAALEEARAGNGFLGTRKCDERGHCYITTPGMQVGAAAAETVGADLKYLIGLPQHEFAAYVAAISDAFINRLVREGVNGMQGVIAASAPPIGYVPAQPKNAKPCDGLTGPVLAACQAAEGTRSGNVALVRSSYANQIDATLKPLQAAQQGLLSMQFAQQTLVGRLSELNSCQIGRNTSGREATAQELAAEQSELATQERALFELEKTVTPLVNARARIVSDTTGDILALQNAMGPIYPLLDPQSAAAYELRIKAQKDALAAKSAKRLPEIQIALQRCISS